MFWSFSSSLVQIMGLPWDWEIHDNVMVVRGIYCKAILYLRDYGSFWLWL